MKSLRLLIAASTISAVTLVSQVRLSHAQYYAQYSSGIQVQNTGNAPANIVVTFLAGNIAFTPSGAIPPGQSVNIYPLPGVVPAGFDGAAIISSDQPIAAVVNILGGNNANNPSQTFGRSAYAAALQGNTTLLLPLLGKQFGSFKNSTWFKVQNLGGSPADIYVNYSNGNAQSQLNVLPGESVSFTQNIPLHTAGTVFAAVVTSTQPIAAAVVQEADPGLGHLSYAYSGFATSSTFPVMPLVNINNNGYKTGIQVQNGGSTPTTVTITYVPAPGVPGNATATCFETKAIAPGASATFAIDVFSGIIPSGTTTNCPANQKFVGSATVTSNSANQPLVAIVNQRQTVVGNGAGAYNAFDPGSGKQKVVFPLILDRVGATAQNYTGFNVQNVGSGTTTVTCTFAGTPPTTRVISATLAPGQALNDVHQFEFAPGFIGSATCTASNPGDRLVGVLNQVAKLAPGDRLYVSEGVSLD
ncbi:MAG: hypothetical protein ACK4WM_03435 [Thermoflexales bacterium]